MLKIKIIFIMAFSMLFIYSYAYASLSVHPQELKDTVSPVINTIPFHITNQGPSGNLSYQLSASENWISFSSVTGDININETAEIEIKIDVKNLSKGIHQANIVVGDPHHGPITVPIEVFVDGVSDVNESSEVNNLSLLVFPNPFNSATELNYILPFGQNVVINVFNINGNNIKTLLNEFQNEGSHKVQFDGSELPSGVYFLNINTPAFTLTKKIILNK